jgi:Chromosome segregation ATPases
MLRRVKVRGFKSFAGEVTLDLGPGLNVIVGPNGSGKSNLGDAVTWALGEQRAGRLRAPGMAEVLYQGGGCGPPAGWRR